MLILAIRRGHAEATSLRRLVVGSLGRRRTTPIYPGFHHESGVSSADSTGVSMVQDSGMSRTPYSSSQDIQMEVLDNPGLQVRTRQRALQSAAPVGRLLAHRAEDSLAVMWETLDVAIVSERKEGRGENQKNRGGRRRREWRGPVDATGGPCETRSGLRHPHSVLNYFLPPPQSSM